jgi:predicted DNA-binding WGR domain protein
MSSSLSAQNVQLVVLDRIGHTRNMARYYVLSVEPTLFDESSLVRECGRMGKRGRRRIELYRDDCNARIALSAWLVRKVRRGYKTRPPVDAA